MINVNLLPKHLRRVREPGYWRFVAVLFPLLVLGTLAFVQYAVNQTVANKQAEVVTLEARKAALQEFIARRNELVAQQQQLNDLIGVRNAVQADRIVWTGELGAVLETLPSQGEALRPRIDFQSLTMRPSRRPAPTKAASKGGRSSPKWTSAATSSTLKCWSSSFKPWKPHPTSAFLFRAPLVTRKRVFIPTV